MYDVVAVVDIETNSTILEMNPQMDLLMKCEVRGMQYIVLTLSRKGFKLYALITFYRIY